MEEENPITTKIKNNIILTLKNETPIKKYFVLISTGAYCPPHKMHFQVFVSAKRYLEAQFENSCVVGALISPTHDQYVTGKLRRANYTSINARHRVEMCNIACRESDWISCSDWEANQNSFVDYDAVTSQNVDIIKQELRKKEFTSRITHKISYVYVCGADHAWKCHLYIHTSKWCNLILAISRPGDSSVSNIMANKSRWSSNFLMCEEPTEDFSSTKIREKMILGESLEEYCHLGVCEYIQKNNITVSKINVNLYI